MAAPHLTVALLPWILHARGCSGNQHPVLLRDFWGGISAVPFVVLSLFFGETYVGSWWPLAVMMICGSGDVGSQSDDES